MKIDTGLSEKTVTSLQNVFKQNPKISFVILYGSRANGNFKNGSDIDLTLKGQELNLSDLLKLENEIDNLLLPYKVDLSLYHQIESAELLEHIERVGKVFYEK